MAEKHYLQVTNDHWRKALLPAPAVAHIASLTETISSNNEIKTPCILQGSDGYWGSNDALENRPSRARTYDLRIRNPLLCPTEL